MYRILAFFSTEEFERGLAILHRRGKNKDHKRKHHYLLKGLIFVRLPDDPDLKKLTGSTSNTHRASGGTPYYCVPRSDVNIPCAIIDGQMSGIMAQISVDPEHVPAIKRCYEEEIAQKLGHRPTSQDEAFKAALKAVNEEEKRALRLYAIGKITDEVWNALWEEWQARREMLRSKLANLAVEQKVHVNNLDTAMALIAKLGILYDRSKRETQKELLRLIVEKVVVDHTGNIVEICLLPPFAYLREVSQRVASGKQERSKHRTQKTSRKATGLKTETICSDWLSSGGLDEIQSEHRFPLKPSLKFLQTIVFPQSTSLQRILKLN